MTSEMMGADWYLRNSRGLLEGDVAEEYLGIANWSHWIEVDVPVLPFDRNDALVGY